MGSPVAQYKELQCPGSYYVRDLSFVFPTYLDYHACSSFLRLFFSFNWGTYNKCTDLSVQLSGAFLAFWSLDSTLHLDLMFWLCIFFPHPHLGPGYQSSFVLQGKACVPSPIPILNLTSAAVASVEPRLPTFLGKEVSNRRSDKKHEAHAGSNRNYFSVWFQEVSLIASNFSMILIISVILSCNLLLRAL